MRAVAAFFGFIAPVATIAGVVFGVVWKVRHPSRPSAQPPSGLVKAIRIVLLVTAVAVVVLGMLLLAYGMIRAMADPTLT